VVCIVYWYYYVKRFVSNEKAKYCVYLYYITGYQFFMEHLQFLSQLFAYFKINLWSLAHYVGTLWSKTIIFNNNLLYRTNKE